MPDIAEQETEKRIDELTAKLDKIYGRAYDEMMEKCNDYFKAFEAQDEKQRALVDAGKLTEEEYQKWRKNKLLTGKRYKQMGQDVAEVMFHTNSLAAQYVNGELPTVYAQNFNYIGGLAEAQVKGYSFDLVSASTVKHMSEKDETLLPYKYVDGRKDERWNTKLVNSEILQGILQGESIPNIAKRLMHVTEMNKASAVRNARTAVTGAQNVGRLDSMKKLDNDGIILKKEWIAARDTHTRQAHLELDRQKVDVNKPFKSSLGDIMYPGDPEADPANVYNCRCAIATVFGGVKPHSSASMIEDEAEKREQEYEQLKKEWAEKHKYIASEYESDYSDISYRKQFNDIRREQVLMDHYQDLLNSDIEANAMEAFNGINSKEELDALRKKATDELGKLEKELEELRENRPRVADYTDEEEFSKARAEYFKKRDALEEKIAKGYDEQTKVYARSWSQISEYRAAESLGAEGIERRLEELDNETALIRKKMKDITDELNVIDQRLEDEFYFQWKGETLKQNGVAYIKPQKMDLIPSEEDIIKRLRGGDMTEGSCASVGLCYAAQKAGYDVLDFRDGESRKYFSAHCREVITHVGEKAPKEQFFHETAGSCITSGKRILKDMPPNKEYYFVCGHHAAIVKKNDAGDIQYLELQLDGGKAWTQFAYNDEHFSQSAEETLKYRFGASKKETWNTEAYAIDVDLLAHDKDFIYFTGFINTPESKQHKGASGYAR